MVRSCSAYNCTSRWEAGGKMSFHKFPINNKDLLQKWTLATNRKGFVPTKASSLCNLHFTPDDFHEQLPKSTRKMLLNSAVPSIFDFHSHMKKSLPKKRRTTNRNQTPVTQVKSEISPSEMETATTCQDPLSPVKQVKSEILPSEMETATTCQDPLSLVIEPGHLLSPRLLSSEAEYDARIVALQADIRMLQQALETTKHDLEATEKEKALFIAELTEQNQRLTLRIKEEKLVESEISPSELETATTCQDPLSPPKHSPEKSRSTFSPKKKKKFPEIKLKITQQPVEKKEERIISIKDMMAALNTKLKVPERLV